MRGNNKLKLITKISVSAAAAVIVFLCSFNGLLGNVDDRFCDFVYQSQDVSYLPMSIVMIDDKTLQSTDVKYSDWSRQVYADLINTLCTDEYSPAVIVFDILFTGNKYDSDGKVDAGDIAFAKAAERAGNVIAGINIVYDETLEGRNDSAIINTRHISDVSYPYKELRDAVSFGYTNEQTDVDNYVRNVIPVVRDGDINLDCLALSTLKQFISFYETNEGYRTAHPELASLKDNSYLSPEMSLYRFSYTSAPQSDEIADHVSLCDILDGKVSALNFKNKIVLVGAYAPGFQDSFNVPLSSDDPDISNSMYGVEIHANIIQALAEEKLQKKLSDGGLALLSVIYALIAGVFCFLMFRLRIKKGAIVGLPVCALIIAAGKICYSNGKYIYLLIPLVAMVLIYIGFIIFFYSATKLEKSRINKAFKMYVAPEIVDEMAADGSFSLHLGGRNKDIAVLFVDIRGFTTMSESLKPEEVVEVLNEYFAIVTDAIFKNKGTLDKFIGDAAMAVFNSPFDLDDYVYRAVCTAIDIAAGSDIIRDKFLERFGKTVNFGIGVNCGEATIGNIGSPFRMDYTAIGDTVNTASRLESNAPAGTILISEEVKSRLGDRIITEQVGEIPLKGKNKSIMVYKVLGLAEV